MQFCSPPRHFVHPALVANAARQRYVNHLAEYVGAGTGTAYFHGVPGVDNFIGNRAGLRGGYELAMEEDIHEGIEASIEASRNSSVPWEIKQVLVKANEHLSVL